MEEEIVLQLVRKQREEQPKAGTPQLYRSLKTSFEAHGIKIGREKLNSLLKDSAMLIKPKRRKTRTTFSEHGFSRYPNLIKVIPIEAPEQVWVSDITFVPVTGGGFVYLFLITDAYSRKIMGWHIAVTMEAKNAVIALEMALENRIYRDNRTIHHSDQGKQYSCPAYTDILKDNKFVISMAGRGKSYENAIAERINGIVKVDLGGSQTYDGLGEARSAFERIINIYNTKRLHSSIDYQTPDMAHSQTGELKRHWKNYRKRRQPNEQAN